VTAPQPPATVPPTTGAAARAGRLVLVLLALGVIGAGGYYGWDRWAAATRMPDGLILVSGRLEGDHVTVASKGTGRVVQMLAREGDQVTEGQVLAELDDTQARARLDQVRHAVGALDAQLQAARATLAQASRDALRYRALAETGTVDRYKREQTDTALAVSTNQVAALEAQLAEARSAVVEAESVVADLTIRAPAPGTITTRVANLGQVLAPGMALFDIVNLDALYLKAYVPETAIGKVRLGLPALVYTDAFPNDPFPATVRYVASRAEFTPKEVQTVDERVKLVYATKLYLDGNPERRLTPGLPADAVVRWKDGTPWVTPRW